MIQGKVHGSFTLLFSLRFPPPSVASNCILLDFILFLYNVCLLVSPSSPIAHLLYYLSPSQHLQNKTYTSSLRFNVSTRLLYFACVVLSLIARFFLNKDIFVIIYNGMKLSKSALTSIPSGLIQVSISYALRIRSVPSSTNTWSCTTHFLKGNIDSSSSSFLSVKLLLLLLLGLLLHRFLFTYFKLSPQDHFVLLRSTE